MIHFSITFPLVLLALAAVAIYVQVTSSTLSLPIATGTTVLTIILPFIAAANFFYLPRFSQMLRQTVTSNPSLLRFLPMVPPVLQAILTVVLATLAAEGFSSGQVTDCSLELNWQRLYKAKDFRAMSRIQDALNCCGLRSVKDRSAPNGRCHELHEDRNDFCLTPWRATMQRNSGLEFGVAVAVGLIQLAHLVLFGLRNSSKNAGPGYRRVIQNIGPSSREGLLENGRVDEEDDGENGNSRRGYGTAENGANHRIEPSGLGEDGNNW
ncbi:uncharacterized protein F4812DRAFT_415887 [Daldinia caldariorum]|uniref:uncharacterized protein n=1 Tax=Daldinia caldariorum TaxID=326644 RepID=UPI00200720D7|nr:uncharacterized protein F4812DRAFT_415887 [Daldinia caldariorum]KAI1471877.1 hypothetical protein F4812DRAFT_415887 [Daldinia caldariorum]